MNTVQRVWIPGPLPGMNDFAGKKSRWHYRQLKANWGMSIGLRIGMAKLTPMARVAVWFDWREKNKRRDPDNIMTGAKFVLDALVDRHILPDDGWAEIAGIRHTFVVDASHPGVMVTLEESPVKSSKLTMDIEAWHP